MEEGESGCVVARRDSSICIGEKKFIIGPYCAV